MGGLSYKEDVTGVIYGFVKDLAVLETWFGSSDFIFCFDSKISLRQIIYSEYKAQRINKVYEDEDFPKEAKEIEGEFRKQVKRLRKVYLPLLGFKNIFIQKGYESDDIIASICNSLPMLDKAVIISADQDLFQLLRKKVSIFDPRTKKEITEIKLKRKFGLDAIEFGIMKCITGCSTDNVKGIPGVGKVTATKYLKKRLSKSSKLYKRIISKEGHEIFSRNLDLITLPFAGVKSFRRRRDELSKAGWKKMCKKLGMKSISRPPSFFRRAKK